VTLPTGASYTAVLGLAATISYQRLSAPLSAGIGMLGARVAKSTVTKLPPQNRVTCHHSDKRHRARDGHFAK